MINGRTGCPAGQKRRPALVVAADVPGSAEALLLADALAGLPVWLKIGLELFTAEGPGLVCSLAGKGFPLFLDLKFHDIPNTVKGAVRSASRLGIAMTTLHAVGGEAMLRAAVEGREEAAAHGARRPLLMGVTVLTSRDGDERSIAAAVVERAELAKACGLDGVVCSGREAAAVKDACGRDFLCLCPGIRFANASSSDDQARVCAPRQAVAQGADFLVMGRPVIRSADPARSARAALEDMEQGFL